MQTYVALLRGINVGGNARVLMAELKVIFESLGFTSVTTYINSGNVIFSAPKKSEKSLASLIEKALEKKYSFSIHTEVRTGESIQKLAQKIPAKWKNDTAMRTDVLFLFDTHDSPATLRKITTNTDVDMLKYYKGAIVWHLDRTHYAQSGMHKFVGTAVYKAMTARNINTVRKLASLIKSH